MNSRDFVLDAVRRNQPAGRPLPDVPRFERPPANLLANFGAALERMGGTIAMPPAEGTLEGLLAERFPQARVICSATREVTGNGDAHNFPHTISPEFAVYAARVRKTVCTPISGPGLSFGRPPDIATPG